MKPTRFDCVLILSTLLLACDQDQTQKQAENPKSQPLSSSVENRIPINSGPQSSIQVTAPRPEPNPEDRDRSMRFLQQRGLKGLGPGSVLERQIMLAKKRKPLSNEEIRKNREEFAKLREKTQTDARKNMLSKDPELRLQALSGLDPEDEKDLQLLERALLSDTNTQVREEAAVQLSVAPSQIAVPALLDALSDPAPEVIVAALESLSAIDADNPEPIIEAIKQIGVSHTDEDVRDAVESALDALQ